MKKTLFYSIALVMSSFFIHSLSAFAGNIVISDQRCLDASLSKTLVGVSTYSNYASIPEASLELFHINILSMVKSQEIRKVPSDPKDALVYLVLRPLNFGGDKKDLYPHFFIRCQVSDVTATHARHECHTLSESDLNDYGRPGAVPPPFGLSQFHSELSLDQGGSNCSASQTSITYRLELVSNEADVAKIQSASGLSAFPLPEDKFFRAYYLNFYQGWVKSLTTSEHH